MRLLFKLPSSLFPVPLRQNWHKETGSLFSWKEFQRLRSIQSSEEKKLVLGGKGVSYSDGCRKGSAHVSPSAELRVRGWVLSGRGSLQPPALPTPLPGADCSRYRSRRAQRAAPVMSALRGPARRGPLPPPDTPSGR